MFKNDDFDFDDDFFKSHHSFWESQWEPGAGGAMDIVIGLACLVGLAVLLALICRCCCSNRYRGRVLQPPPDPNSSVPVPPGYPQQQYSTVTVTTLPVGHSTGPAYPTGGAPYPAGGVTYPVAGAAYPGAAGPYPGAGAPYPAAGAPYPAVAPYPPGPYPGAMPQPGSAPSAPDAQALPPSYDQVMSNEAKHPPFNPYAPH